MTTPFYPVQGVVNVEAAFHEEFFLDAGTRLTTEHVVTAGTYAAGTVLGRITATGLLVESDPTAGDGSEVPFAILLEDWVSTADDELGVLVQSTARINYRKLVANANWVKADLIHALSLRGIHVTTPYYSAP